MRTRRADRHRSGRLAPSTALSAVPLPHFIGEDRRARRRFRSQPAGLSERAHDRARGRAFHSFHGRDADLRRQHLSLGLCAGAAEARALAAARRVALAASLIALVTAIALAPARSGLDGRRPERGPRREHDRRGHRRYRLRPCVGGALRAGGGARRGRLVRSARPLGAGGAGVGGAAGQPRPRRPRGDAERRRRGSASPEPCGASPGGGSLARRPHSLRDVPSRFRDRAISGWTRSRR